MVDTGCVSDDQRRSVVSLSLAYGFEGLGLIGAHSHLCYVNIAVGCGYKTEVFFADTLARCGKFGDCADRSGFRGLTAGVGVYFGVEYEDVDIFA